VLVGWWLLHAFRIPVDDTAGRDLLAVYVALPPRIAAPAPSATRRAGRVHRRGPRPPPVARAGAHTDARTVSASAVLAQALDIARRQAMPTFQADPFADRPSRLPGERKERFRMVQVSPADVVVGIGAFLFYPPGYEADQCPRNRRNLHKLLAGGDSPRLRLALEYEREYCRP
jgi:hypothetical protein